MKHNKAQNIYENEPGGRRARKLIFRWLRRGMLLALVGAGIYGYYAYANLSQILNGPSPAARDKMAIYLLERR